MSSQSAEMVALQGRFKEAQLLLSDLQSKQLPEQYELARAEHDRLALTSKVQYLEGELARRNSAEAEYRAGRDAQLYDLEAQVSELRANLDSKTATIGSLKVGAAGAFGHA